MCGGGIKSSPQTYTPTGQPQADMLAQTGIQNLSNTGQNLQSSVDPALQQITSNVINNPYYTRAMGGIQNVSDLSQGVGNADLSAGAGLQALGTQAGAMGSNYANQATSYGSAAAPIAQGYGQATAGIPGVAGAQGYSQLQGLIPATTGPELAAALQVLNTGFDPQKTLYNQQYQQNMDQTNAINAMYGVAGSPYGAGVAGKSAQDFNTNWQNQQLARQIQALSGYDSAASTAAGNAANLVGTGTGVLNAGLTTGQNLLNTGLTTGQSLLNNGINTGVNAMTSLGGLQNTSAMNASQLGTQGLNTLAQGAQMPYDLYLQQQQAGLGALGSQIQGTNAAAGLTQAGIGDALNYMKTGQDATSVNQNAVQQDNSAAAAQSAGFGNLFGSLTSMFKFAPIKL